MFDFKLKLDDPKFARFNNRSTLNGLIRLIRDNRVIPFVGAGMSIDIYHSWASALREMMEGHFGGKETEAKQIEELISNSDYDGAAEKIQKALEGTQYLDRLVEVFDEAKIEDEDLKKMPVWYLTKIFPKTLVITTNFDKVLERVFLLEQYHFVEKIALRHLSEWQADRVKNRSPHYLIKIHGCVAAPDEVVMTKTSYDELYKDPKHIARLRNILTGNTMLFIGCSLNTDRTVKLLQEADLKGHYAILEMNGEEGESEFEERRLFMSRVMQIECIWYPKGEHVYVENILDYIYHYIGGQLKEAQLEVAPKKSRIGRNHSPAQVKESTEATKPAVKPLKKNDTYMIGRYNGKPIDWLILDVQPDKALLIAKDCLFTAPYNDELTRVTWGNCSLRNIGLPRLLNEIFDTEERKQVLRCTNQNPENEYSGISGGKATEDELFLLNIDEVKQYFPYDEARIARLDGVTVWWWLRSPGSFLLGHAANVSSGGSVHDVGSHVSWSEGAVRPAFWLNLES